MVKNELIKLLLEDKSSIKNISDKLSNCVKLLFEYQDVTDRLVSTINNDPDGRRKKEAFETVNELNKLELKYSRMVQEAVSCRRKFICEKQKMSMNDALKLLEALRQKIDNG